MPDSPCILLVAEPGVDGVFTHVHGLGHYLVEKGYQVHLAYSDKRGSPELLKFVDYIRNHGGRCLNLSVSNAPHWRDIFALQRLRMLAKEIKPDVIHAHSSKAGVLCRALAVLGVRAKYFYTPHAYYGLARRNGMATIYNGIESLLGGIGGTINASEDERKFAMAKLKISPERCVTIPYPVDTEIFHPMPLEQKKELRRKLNLPENAVILGSMGRLSFQKDPATLYRAFAQVLRQGADLYLVHAGRGELQREMEELADSLKINHRLLRFEYFRNPVEFHSAIDAFILTSRYEGGWPLSFMEALASDLPIICGTGPGTSDLVNTDLSHCWTVRPEDVDGFAKAINAWLSDRKPGRLCNHRLIALERYNADKCYGDVLRTYNLEARSVPLPYANAL